MLQNTIRFSAVVYIFHKFGLHTLKIQFSTQFCAFVQFKNLFSTGTNIQYSWMANTKGWISVKLSLMTTPDDAPLDSGWNCLISYNYDDQIISFFLRSRLQLGSCHFVALSCSVTKKNVEILLNTWIQIALQWFLACWQNFPKKWGKT